jgi:uncharacterized Zn finger protein
MLRGRSSLEPTANAEATDNIAPLERVRSARLPCEVCRAETPHRILRVDRPRGAGSRRASGIARCQTCRWTHPFEVALVGTVDIARIVSEGARSERTRIPLPRGRRLQVGSGLPGSDRALRIQRIDTRDGRNVRAASTDDIATVWAVRDVGAVVPVSIVEGRRTRSARLVVPRGTRYAVGDRVTVARARLDIVALRARGKTWRQPGDTFAAEDVQRMYGRRVAAESASRSFNENRRSGPVFPRAVGPATRAFPRATDGAT